MTLLRRRGIIRGGVGSEMLCCESGFWGLRERKRRGAVITSGLSGLLEVVERVVV
jgi:hypothetical protein